MSKFAFYWCAKAHDKGQLGEERVYVILQLRAFRKRRQAGNLEAETEAEAVEGAAFCLVPSDWLRLPSFFPGGQHPKWAVPFHICQEGVLPPPRLA